MAASLSDYCPQNSHGAEYDAFGHNCQIDKHFLNCNVQHDDCRSSWSKFISFWYVLSDRKEIGSGIENICRGIDRFHNWGKQQFWRGLACFCLKMSHLVDHCWSFSQMSAGDFAFSESMVYEQNLIFHGWVALQILVLANLYMPLRRLITHLKGL